MLLSSSDDDEFKQQQVKQVIPSPPLTPPIPSMRVWTRQLVAQTVSEGQLLIIANDKVYDLTKWVAHHPGGALAIQRMIGMDATDAMIAFHPQWVFEKRLPHFCVGILHPDSCYTSPVSLAYRELHSSLNMAGLFKRNDSFFVREIVKFLLLWVGMVGLAVYGPNTVWNYTVSALLAATLWHQAAFVAHDAGHSGITHDRQFDTLFGICLADFFGGLSLGWWKRNHNVHHIVTNDPEHDPDIQHLPFLAVSPRFTENLFSSYYGCVLEFDQAAKLFVPKQHWLFYIILAFGRFNLYANSWSYVLSRSFHVPFRSFEIVGMLCFWTWFGWMLCNLPSWQHALVYVLVSHMATVFLHLQITLSHFGMSTVEHKTQVGEFLIEETYAEKALRTTMDVDCPRWMDWFHGGLQFQIEHHLFPRIPRPNLRRVRPLVESFARENNLEFHAFEFVAGNRYVLGVLEQVAHQIKAVLSVDPARVHIH